MGTATLDTSAVFYAGVSPGTAGLYQLNIQVPNSIADGNYPLVLTLGTFTTPAGGFITVKNQVASPVNVPEYWTMAKLVLALAALVVSAASAADLPNVKEGFWTVHTQTVDNPGAKKSEGTYSLCRDHAFDQAATARAKSVKSCTTVSEHFQAGKYSVEMHCTVAGSVIETKGVTTFQNDTAFPLRGARDLQSRGIRRK